jgi:hypothetical protein
MNGWRPQPDPVMGKYGCLCHLDQALASAFHEVWVADAADYARSPLSRENAAV